MSPVRMSKMETPMRVVLAYKEAFNNRDADAILAMLSDDCVFEPVENGIVLKGKDEIKTYLGELFARLSDAKLTSIDLFQAGFHVVFRWELEGTSGADIFKFREDLICEKLSYAKK